MSFTPLATQAVVTLCCVLSCLPFVVCSLHAGLVYCKLSTLCVCCCSAAVLILTIQGPDYDTAVRCAGSAKSTAEAHKKAEQVLADTYRNIFALANAVPGLQFFEGFVHQ